MNLQHIRDQVNDVGPEDDPSMENAWLDVIDGLLASSAGIAESGQEAADRIKSLWLSKDYDEEGFWWDFGIS
jgi:hypothetical protein